MELNTQKIHESWSYIYQKAIKKVDPAYLQRLSQDQTWLPGHADIFNAFTQPRTKTRYILLGESPYPRANSANGYAFWDAAVDGLWSNTGLSKAVNKATSLRNFMKMLLVADGQLEEDTSQMAIQALNKRHYISTAEQLFNNMLKQGFLLLNASLVLSHKPVKYDAKAWLAFLETLLAEIAAETVNDKQSEQPVQLLLFGNIAKIINKIASSKFKRLVCEHPYNISFIHNSEVLNFFRPLRLLKKRDCETMSV